jgi:hypothetical protein
VGKLNQREENGRERFGGKALRPQLNCARFGGKDGDQRLQMASAAPEDMYDASRRCCPQSLERR